MVLYLQKLHPTAICGCFTRLARDVTLISEADLQHLGPVDMMIAGWPCQGHLRVGACRGLKDPRSSLLWDLIRLMQWWFVHQPSPPWYIFENVYFLEDYRDKVLEGQHYVYQHLGEPIFVDAAILGSYDHRPQWIWTNLAPLSTLVVAFCAVPPPFDMKVDHILDSYRIFLPVV